MAPLQFKDEILVLAWGAQRSGRVPGTTNHAVAHTPRLWRAINVHPSVQILAIEQWNEFLVVRSRDGRRGKQKHQGN